MSAFDWIIHPLSLYAWSSEQKFDHYHTIHIIEYRLLHNGDKRGGNYDRQLCKLFKGRKTMMELALNQSASRVGQDGRGRVGYSAPDHIRMLTSAV